jgi:sugar phosphate isomerase/epimerase
MMNHFTISAFADEISTEVNEQIRVLTQNGISHIEVRGLDGKNVSELTLEEVKEYKKKFDAAGISVSSIGSPIGKININDPFEQHLELFKHVLNIAEVFESPFIRMFSFFIDETENYDDYEKQVIERWQQFLEVAKNFPKITLLHENEKEIYGDTPERCLNLLNKLNSSQLKAAFDPANFVQCDVEVYPKAFEMLKDHIVYMHIKDAKYSDHEVTPAGHGDGKIYTVLNNLSENNFKGFASLEPHLTMFDGFAELENKNVSGLKEDDNIRLFNVAAHALKKIIVDDMKQEWK